MRPFKKSKKTGVMYRGISMEDYSHCYEYMYDIIYKLVKTPASLNTDKNGKIIFPNNYDLKNVSDREKQILKKDVNNWDMKWTLSDDLIEPGPLKYSEVYGMYEVIPSSVPYDLKDEVYETYFKPSIGKYIKPRTKEAFEGII